jgi:copper(I)-binding protein
MRPIKGGLEIKPGETVELKPGSFHVMFVGLKKPLTAGEHISATLVFEKAGAVNVEYDVRAMGAAPGKDMPGMQMPGH